MIFNFGDGAVFGDGQKAGPALGKGNRDVLLGLIQPVDRTLRHRWLVVPVVVILHEPVPVSEEPLLRILHVADVVEIGLGNLLPKCLWPLPLLRQLLAGSHQRQEPGLVVLREYWSVLYKGEDGDHFCRLQDLQLGEVCHHKSVILEAEKGFKPVV